MDVMSLSMYKPLLTLKPLDKFLLETNNGGWGSFIKSSRVILIFIIIRQNNKALHNNLGIGTYH